MFESIIRTSAAPHSRRAILGGALAAGALGQMPGGWRMATATADASRTLSLVA
jgi:hypothetical protein